MAKRNPVLKKGDYVKVLRSGSYSSIKGVIGEITKVSGDAYSFSNDNGYYTIYRVNNGDEFEKANKDDLILHLNTEITELEERLTEKKQKVEFLKKYDTEEDFVAEKLESILTTHSKGTTPRERVKGIAAILKELKSSELL